MKLEELQKYSVDYIKTLKPYVSVNGGHGVHTKVSWALIFDIEPQ